MSSSWQNDEAGSTDLNTWCSDALHDVLGFTDSTLASYLVSLAKRKGASPSTIRAELEQGGVVGNNSNAQILNSFCQQLYSKCHGQSSGSFNIATSSSNKTKKKNNADWIKQAKSYKLVEDDDDEEEAALNIQPQQQQQNENKDKSKKKKKSRKRRLDEEEEETTSKQKKSSKDNDQDRDLRERDEFVQRMLERDAEKKNKKERQRRERQEEKNDLVQRLVRGETVQQKETGQAINVDMLRQKSRSEYLKKRQDRELQLLEQELQDEQELFGQVELTKAEKKRLELGRAILKKARQDQADDEDNEDDNNNNDGFYRLPQDYNQTKSKAKQDQALLTSRYKDSMNGGAVKTEQQLWEEAQTSKATAKKKKRDSTTDKEYDYVFEEQIDFVMQGTHAGYDERRQRDKKQKAVIKKEEPTKSVESKPMTQHEEILERRKQLPVFSYREEFLAAVKNHQVLILVGETGSGKTTQIPQYLNEVGYGELGKIGCTQPRRVAAMSVAARVAVEMNVRLGHEVGYSIRFEHCTSPKTVIEYMTDGMLLREILTEPDLASFSCLVIDEAHERTLHTDILFGLVKDIVRFRDDLRLIISSATLDAEKFSKYFDDASIFMIPGRMFPVDIFYTKAPEADYVDAAIITVLQIHVSQKLDGDILVFLTGQDEIESAAEALTQKTRDLGRRIAELIICPIYANLPSEQQALIFEPTPKGARKVVLATNIAETSLTINGICYVIDCGFSKQNSFNAKSGMESLIVTPISQASSNQRAGRAGRTQPGKCFRLFTAWSFQNELEPNTIPEILRTNLANVVLMLKSLGIHDLVHFDFMDRPPADALIRALEQLYALGALNDGGELTKLGRRMAEFPLDPMLSKSVLASEKYSNCTSLVLSAVAMLSLGGASVFYRPKEKAVHADTARMNFARGGGGDHMTLVRCYDEWASTDYSQQWCFENFVQVKSMKKARSIREQLEGLCERVELNISPPTDDNDGNTTDLMTSCLKAITSGFFYNVAKFGRKGEYTTIKQPRTVYIHPSSVLAKEEQPPPWIVFFELALTSKEYMRQVAPIEPSWLVEIAPHYYQESDVVDSKQQKKMPRRR